MWALLVIDFQVDFCPGGALAVSGGDDIAPVVNALADFVLLQADVTANDADDQALLQGHFGLPGPPSIMFYDRDGQERKNYRVVGYMEAEAFAEHVKKAVP